MKQLNVFLFVSICAIGSLAQAQIAQPGIYISGNDFDTNKISSFEIKGKKYKLKLHDTFYKPFIEVESGDSTIKLYKDSIFGYRDKGNVSFCFFDKNIYTVMNQREKIILYKRQSSGGYKNTETIVRYFFSKDASSPILPLTRTNLKDVFQSDSSFYEIIDMCFDSDDELITYDNTYKIFKINRVYEFSHKNK
ncbi:MAG TPA: hypothetical protein VJY62_11675 [Bacteroidia bacterium]|nr:hypothetical protein [Bacteroidia bacterium]